VVLVRGPRALFGLGFGLGGFQGAGAVLQFG
jgi:hypothetical protein